MNVSQTILSVSIHYYALKFYSNTLDGSNAWCLS